MEQFVTAFGYTFGVLGGLVSGLAAFILFVILADKAFKSLTR